MPQSSKHVEQMAPELEKIVSPSEPIHDLADGFGGAHGPAEGPLWWKEGRLRWTPKMRQLAKVEPCP